MHELLEPHPRLVECLGLEVKDGKVWALRFQLVRPGKNIRQYIVDTSDLPADMPTRLELAAQFTEGLVYLYSRNAIWFDLSTRNVTTVLVRTSGVLDVILGPCMNIDGNSRHIGNEGKVAGLALKPKLHLFLTINFRLFKPETVWTATHGPVSISAASLKVEEPI